MLFPKPAKEGRANNWYVLDLVQVQGRKEDEGSSASESDHYLSGDDEPKFLDNAKQDEYNPSEHRALDNATVQLQGKEAYLAKKRAKRAQVLQKKR